MKSTLQFRLGAFLTTLLAFSFAPQAHSSDDGRWAVRSAAQALHTMEARVVRDSLSEVDSASFQSAMIAAISAKVPDGEDGEKCLARAVERAKSKAQKFEEFLWCTGFSTMRPEQRNVLLVEIANDVLNTGGAIDSELLLVADFPMWDDTNSAAVGLVLESRDDGIFVKRTVEGSPASKTSIQPGWRLFQIHETSVDPKDLETAIKALKGPAGSSIWLSFVSGEETHFTKVERALIPPANDAVLVSNIGHTVLLKIRSMPAETTNRTKQLLSQYDAISHLVIDLRGNEGGSLDEVISLADLFARKGTIATMEERRNGAVSVAQRYQAKKRPTLSALGNNTRITILMNERTASGSEILAGALVELADARLVGTRSYGRDTIQSLFPLNRDLALKLTTGRIKVGEDVSLAEGLEPHCLADDLPGDGAALIEALSAIEFCAEAAG